MQHLGLGARRSQKGLRVRFRELEGDRYEPPRGILNAFGICRQPISTRGEIFELSRPPDEQLKAQTEEGPAGGLSLGRRSQRACEAVAQIKCVARDAFARRRSGVAPTNPACVQDLPGVTLTIGFRVREMKSCPNTATSRYLAYHGTGEMLRRRNI